MPNVSIQVWGTVLLMSLSLRIMKRYSLDFDPGVFFWEQSKLERRAVQLRLHEEVLARYSKEWIMDIEDLSAFAHEHYQYVCANDYASLMTPLEKVYPVNNAQIAARLGISIA